MKALALLVLLAGTTAFVPAAEGPPANPAVAAIVARVTAARLRATDTRLVAFGTRNLFSESGQPRGRGVFAARDWLVAQFGALGRDSGGRLSVALDTFMQPRTDNTPREVQVSSVIATLRGDDPARGTIVISSHYDSRNSDGNDAIREAPGADDNGSGTSAVLEAARVLVREHFPGTIVFACFDGEEQGLFGSAHYAKTLKERGVKVEANLNNDIIGASVAHDGTSDPDDVRLFSEALPVGANPRRVDAIGSENDSPARELARFVKETAGLYVPGMNVELIYRSDRFLRGGDQQSFAEQGYPAVRFVEAHENYDHQHQTIRLENGTQYGDLLTYMDFDYLARVTQINVAALATLALAPPAPEAGVLNRTLGYDTTLQWARVPGATQYELVWRSTSDPLWTHVKNVGDVNTATLEATSKDDWIVGVRALNAAEMAGPVAYPQPFR